MFEAEHLATLRVDPGHNMPDGTVFSRRVHGLKDQEESMPVGSIVKLLHGAQLRNVILQKAFIMLLRLVKRIDHGWPLFEVDLVSLVHAKVL